jgi:polysaccharide export outer membrane protein
MIIVSAEDPEIAMPFNLQSVSMVASRQDLVLSQQNNAIVSRGCRVHDFPVLKLQISGLTRFRT